MQSRLNDTTEGTAQNRHTPRIEVSGEVPEVPTGYTLQLPIKPTAIQMQQVVYQNIQQNTLLLDSTAWQSKFSVNERMGKILDLYVLPPLLFIYHHLPLNNFFFLSVNSNTVAE